MRPWGWSILIGVWAISFYYGAQLAKDGEVDFTQMMTVSTARFHFHFKKFFLTLVTGNQCHCVWGHDSRPGGCHCPGRCKGGHSKGVLLIGNIVFLFVFNSGGFAQAKVAATRVFRLLTLIPDIDSRVSHRASHILISSTPFCSTSNITYPNQKSDGIIPKELKGDVAFKDIVFEYPTRKEGKCVVVWGVWKQQVTVWPTVIVLKGLNASVDHGNTLALVGESGCGKSTLIALTER